MQAQSGHTCAHEQWLASLLNNQKCGHRDKGLSDCTQARERDWSNVITAHAGEAAAYTWRLSHFTLGQHALLPPDAPQQQHLHAGPPVSAVGISCCGNFGLVGNEGGRVDRYNLQSGIHRGTYCRQQQQQPGAPGDSVGRFSGAGLARSAWLFVLGRVPRCRQGLAA